MIVCGDDGSSKRCVVLFIVDGLIRSRNILTE